MNENIFEQITASAKILGIDLYTAALPQFAFEQNMSEESLSVLAQTMEHLAKLKNQSVVETLLRLSRSWPSAHERKSRHVSQKPAKTVRPLRSITFPFMLLSSLSIETILPCSNVIFEAIED